MEKYLHMQAAKDYRTDADLNAACQADAKQLCADVNPGQGRIQVCSAAHNELTLQWALCGHASAEQSPQGRRKHPHERLCTLQKF